jgi:hypothetical protein
MRGSGPNNEELEHGKGKVLNMQESIVNTSPRRRILRRIMVAVLALAAVLTLGACRATGGGTLPPQIGLYKGQANFGFNFTCEVETEKKRAVIRGEVTYHDSGPVTIGSKTFPDGIRIHGTVDPFFIELTELPKNPPEDFEPPLTCENADVLAQIVDVPYARFQGEYRSQDTTLPTPDEPGRFQVDVHDMGEPEPSIEGDSFDILLTGGEYGEPLPYSRFGYVEGGNIQVENE